jgi:ABC-type multidrug transport system ATPase subunit
MLSFEQVSHTYGGRRVLDRVTFEVGPGIVGLIGDNGAGKTTLLRIAAGIVAPTAGTVRLFGEEVRSGRAALMRRVGALIEKPGHYDELPVAGNLEYFYSFYAPLPREELRERVHRSLERFGLAGVADRKAGELSLGMRQRLAIARAVHPWASLVLLDEPFDSLDPRARAEIKQQLRALRAEGKTVLFSSHNLADVEALCDSIHLVRDGGVEGFSSFEALRAAAGDGGPAEDLDTLYTRLAGQGARGAAR